MIYSSQVSLTLIAGAVVLTCDVDSVLNNVLSNQSFNQFELLFLRTTNIMYYLQCLIVLPFRLIASGFHYAITQLMCHPVRILSSLTF